MRSWHPRRGGDIEKFRNCLQAGSETRSQPWSLGGADEGCRKRLAAAQPAPLQGLNRHSGHWEDVAARRGPSPPKSIARAKFLVSTCMAAGVQIGTALCQNRHEARKGGGEFSLAGSYPC